jgi:branched-subunit amino acid aminotransferase/4-amino-4-deoxychorismate lyase
VTIYDPELDFGHPGDRATPHVLVTTRPAANQPLPPLRVASVRYGRELPQVKHIGLFGTVQQRRLTQQDGFDDALFVDGDGRVLEGATWNVGFYDGRRVVWPESACLPGITMALINQVYGGPMVSSPVSLPQVLDMEAAFATNAAVGVRLIRGIDGVAWEREHHILTELRKEYVDIPVERL